MIPLVDKLTAIIDIETTEATLADARGTFPEIVEIAAITVNSEYEIQDTFTMVVQPSNMDDFTEFSHEFTGIKYATVREAPLWKDCWKEFAQFVGYNRCRIISWGAPFDFGVLKTSYGRIGVGWPHKYPFIDAISIAYQISREYGMDFGSWKLKSVCERLGLPVEGRHRATGGAHACFNVLKELSTLDETNSDISL